MQRALLASLVLCISFIGEHAMAETNSPIPPRPTTLLDGKKIEIANRVTVLQDGDRALLERERRYLERFPRVDALPYKEVRDIPDVESLGYGDCKVLAKAYRNRLIKHGFDPDSLLIALADTDTGVPHAVLIMRVKEDARLLTLVYDVRVGKIETIDESIASGYSYNEIESYPEGQFIRWNGRSYT